jgi:hypothetical protein
MGGKKMFTTEMLIFMSIAIVIAVAIPIALLMAEERRKHQEWRESWKDGKSEIAGGIELLKKHGRCCPLSQLTMSDLIFYWPGAWQRAIQKL